MADRATIGNVQIAVFVDVAPPPFETSRFFPDAAPDSWASYKQWLDQDGKFRTNFCFFLLRSSGRTILVDTGLGPGPHERFGGATGQLMAKLSAEGVKPEDVSAVVITHLHGDHVGWNTITQQGGTPRPTFPKARYYIPKGDWEHFSKSNPGYAPLAQVTPLAQKGVAEFVEGDFAVTPELTMLSTPGHTPGHLSVLISSAGQKGIIVGDLYHNPVQVTELDWCAGADMNKDDARKSRKAATQRMVNENMTVAAPHFWYPSNIGKVVRLSGKTVWKSL
ncbi:MAG: MBL fold metallo-hydrolase [Chloroflexi bacterium]|nr:MBL fold metallo-hydrolase [Chloroflexota bacterium]